MSSLHVSARLFDRWQNELHRGCGRFQSAPPRQADGFIGEIALHDRGGLELAHIRTNAGRIARLQGNGERGDGRHCFLIINSSGHAEIRKACWSVRLGPGDMALMDSARPCEILPAGLIDHLSFHLERDTLCRHLAPNQRLFGKLDLASTSGRLLASLAVQIHGEGAPAACSQDEGAALQNALIALLLPTLRGGALAGGIPDEAPHATLLRDRAQRLIGQRLHDAQLTPQSLAEQLHISIRQLYRLFEDSGDSVCRYIQRQRLQRSAEDLLDPQLRHESITRIAFKWGFADSAHFSRAFKREFDRSPREYRLHGGGH